MIEIGLKLKEKREENGVSVEEVAEDLKVRPSQIVSLEEGKRENFKDVVFLKYFIRDYAKYLGLDGEQLVDEFNEYLFDYTSKIPLDVIEKAKNEKKEIKKDFISPYTVKKKTDFFALKIIIAFVVVIGLVLGGYLLFSDMKENEFSDNDITYVIRR